MPRKHDDKQALKVILKQLDGQSGTALQGMDSDERDQAPAEVEKGGDDDKADRAADGDQPRNRAKSMRRSVM